MRFLISSSLLMVAALGGGASQVSDQQCASFTKKPVSAEKLLPTKKLTDTEITLIERQRACLKGYSYPGGEEALLKATPAELKADLVHLQWLFDSHPQFGALSKNDQLRALRIEMGWNREQVLLWGNFFYLRQLSNDEQYETVIQEAERIRKDFGLTVQPLKVWDAADANTYFSPQTLRNMISALEYDAKGHVMPKSGSQRDALVKEYLIDEAALRPTMEFTGNPGESVLGPICTSRTKAASAAQ